MENDFGFDVMDLGEDMMTSPARRRTPTKNQNENNFAKIGFFQRRFVKNKSAAGTPNRESAKKSRRAKVGARGKVFRDESDETVINFDEEEDGVDADVEDNDSVLVHYERKERDNKRHRKTTDLLKNSVFDNERPPFSSANSAIKTNYDLIGNTFTEKKPEVKEESLLEKPKEKQEEKERESPLFNYKEKVNNNESDNSMKGLEKPQNNEIEANKAYQSKVLPLPKVSPRQQPMSFAHQSLKSKNGAGQLPPYLPKSPPSLRQPSPTAKQTSPTAKQTLPLPGQRQQTQTVLTRNNKRTLDKSKSIPVLTKSACDFVADSRQEQLQNCTYLNDSCCCISTSKSMQPPCMKCLQLQDCQNESLVLDEKKYPIGEAPEILIQPYEEDQQITQSYSYLSFDINQEPIKIDSSSIDSFFSSAALSISESFAVPKPDIKYGKLIDDINSHSETCSTKIKAFDQKNEMLKDRLELSRDQFSNLTNGAENISKMVDSINEKTEKLLNDNSGGFNVTEALGFIGFHISVVLLWIFFVVRGIILSFFGKHEDMSFNSTYKFVMEKAKWIEKIRETEGITVNDSESTTQTSTNK